MNIVSAKEITLDQKSVAQVEEELLKKHEEEISEIPKEEISEVPKEDFEPILDDKKVLSYINDRYNKKINSFDELMSERDSSGQLPEDVASFLKYKKETGRGIEDFIKLNKDYDSLDSSQLVKEYLMSTQEGLDEDDIDVMMDSTLVLITDPPD